MGLTRLFKYLEILVAHDLDTYKSFCSLLSFIACHLRQLEYAVGDARLASLACVDIFKRDRKMAVCMSEFSYKKTCRRNNCRH